MPRRGPLLRPPIAQRRSRGISSALTTSSAEEPSSTAKQLREQVLRVHTAAHSSSTLKSSLTGLVIDRPLVRVGQHLVRVSQVFEELWVTTLVRVVLQRATVSKGHLRTSRVYGPGPKMHEPLSVGLLDLIVAGTRGDAEEVANISLTPFRGNLSSLVFAIGRREESKKVRRDTICKVVQ